MICQLCNSILDGKHSLFKCLQYQLDDIKHAIGLKDKGYVAKELEDVNKEKVEEASHDELLGTIHWKDMEIKNLHAALKESDEHVDRLHASQEKCNIRAQQAEVKAIKLQKVIDTKNRVIENLTISRENYRLAAVKLRETVSHIIAYTDDEYPNDVASESLRKTEWIK